MFVSLESLSKHKKLYCKHRADHYRTEPQVKKEESTTSLSSLLDALYNRDHQQMPPDIQIDTTTSINDLLNKLMHGNLTPPRPYGEEDPPAAVSPVVPPTPANADETHNPFDAAFANALPAPFDRPADVSADSSHQFDDILVQWVEEVLRIEGKFRHNLGVKEETFNIINRMVQDGLISTNDHGNLMYVNRLFIRLHDLIHMSTTPLNGRREIIDIMLELFQMRKLTKTAFIELCVNNI